MEINVNSYLEKYSKSHKDYIKNDLISNQTHLAKALQYIYVVGDCADTLKGYIDECEQLRDENRRLKFELQQKGE